MKIKKRQIITVLLVLFISTALTFNLTACSAVTMEVEADNIMEGISANEVTGRSADERFVANAADFSIELFKNTVTQGENSLISPLSVLLALSMTANGADNNTLAQMETLLGGDIPLDELNEYLYGYVKSLPSEEKARFTIANSIWFRDDENRLTVEKVFLQKNADYYAADAYKSPFDNQTLEDINSWVKENTDGMIDKILEEIRDDAVMYLINAIVFDAEWETVYNKANVSSGEFTALDGAKQTVDFMWSEEGVYLEDNRSKGFIKPYANDNYSLVALLPNEEVGLKDYIASLTGESFLNIIKESQDALVSATLPKFSYDYKITMNDALKELGIPEAFNPTAADFGRLGRSSRGNIYIGEVLHKTFISVDELGTKAGAVTKVEMRDEAYVEPKIVKLDRPFLYAIIDNSTSLPVFIGTVTSIEE